MRALVTAGDITLPSAGVATRYPVGEVFVMPAGQEHRETVGAAGVSYLVGTR